jgi:arsenate reductase
MAELGAGVAG